LISQLVGWLVWSCHLWKFIIL